MKLLAAGESPRPSEVGAQTSRRRGIAPVLQRPRGAIGHRTSYTTVYSVPARHGWRKLTSHPFRPDRDVDSRNDFKKGVFALLPGRRGGLVRPAVVVYGSCSPTKRGSAGSTVLGDAGCQRGKAESCVPTHWRIHLTSVERRGGCENGPRRQNASRYSERPDRRIIHNRPENNVHPATIGQRKGAEESYQTKHTSQ
jgi:hypothetical protein